MQNIYIKTQQYLFIKKLKIKILQVTKRLEIKVKQTGLK